MSNFTETSSRPFTGGASRVAHIGVILILAFIVRTIGITWGMPNKYHVTTYNCDEYTMLISLQGMNPSKLDFNPVSEKDPWALGNGTFPLYTYAAMIKALSMTGWITLTGDKEFYYQNIEEWNKFFLVGRLLSVFYGVLTVWLIYLLAGKMYGQRTALLSALFMACMPAHAVYSRYMLANGPGIFWIVLAFCFLKSIIDTGRTRDYFLVGMSAGLAIATRYSAAPLIPMIILAHFMNADPLKNIKKLALGLLASFLFFLAVSPYAILDYRNFLKGLGIVKYLSTGGSEQFMLFKNIAAVSSQATEALGVFLFLLCLAGIAVALAKRKRYDILLLSWILPMLIIFIKAGNTALAGRILPALPFMAVLGARSLDLAWDRKPTAAKIMLAAILAHAALFYCASFKLILSRDIRDAASEWMIGNIKPGSSIGLVREPSWFNPGIIDRKYRHPDHRQLPDYKFIPLAGGDFRSVIGYDRLGEVKPDFVIASDVETGPLPEPDFLEALNGYGYREIKKFENRFSVLNFKTGNHVPAMLFVPDHIYVFEKANDPVVKSR